MGIVSVACLLAVKPDSVCAPSSYVVFLLGRAYARGVFFRAFAALQRGWPSGSGAISCLGTAFSWVFRGGRWIPCRFCDWIRLALICWGSGMVFTGCNSDGGLPAATSGVPPMFFSLQSRPGLYTRMLARDQPMQRNGNQPAQS